MNRPLFSSNRRAIAAAALVGGLAMGSMACSAATDTGVDVKRVAATATQVTGENPSVPVETGGPAVSWAVAAATAERSIPGGVVTDVELEGGAWEVDVMTPEPRVHNVSVDAATGALLGSRADRMPDQARSYLQIPLGKLAAATVARADAANIALGAVDRGYVREVSIQGTENRPVWRIEIADGTTRHEIDVDARSAAVVRHDTEREEDRGRGDYRRDNDRGRGDTRRDVAAERRDPAISDWPERVRERSHDFGRDHYDWSVHVPR
ncbi:PepSY domain-containing protein [Nocardia concava]|uniref:PepSY domain-containing protein n=1 Tax=Nocardia concava TaxID=257281 RepID=UPI0012FB0670|nr:PepSY domain-containing protein [Nocardia concava]